MFIPDPFCPYGLQVTDGHTFIDQLIVDGEHKLLSENCLTCFYTRTISTTKPVSCRGNCPHLCIDNKHVFLTGVQMRKLVTSSTRHQ